MEDWRQHAACRGEPVSVFYPETEARAADYVLPKSICLECPVRTQCLEFALTDEAGAFGCWGGTSPRERKLIRRRRRLGEVRTLDIVLQVTLDI